MVIEELHVFPRTILHTSVYIFHLLGGLAHILLLSLLIFFVFDSLFLIRSFLLYIIVFHLIDPILLSSQKNNLLLDSLLLIVVVVGLSHTHLRTTDNEQS